jgi:peptide/nickel transport system permease protein
MRMNTELTITTVAAPPTTRPAWRALPTLPTPLVAGTLILIGWALASLLVPLLAGRDPLEVTYGAKLLPPSGQFLLGSDALGRDVLLRTVVAFRYDLLIAVGSVALAAVVGFLGALPATRLISTTSSRVLDVISAFPSSSRPDAGRRSARVSAR